MRFLYAWLNLIGSENHWCEKYIHATNCENVFPGIYADVLDIKIF